jgi:kinesin family protein 2/24
LEDSFGESQLVGAVEHKPTTANELLAVISQSMKFRKTSPTVKNDTSSRSHAVCRIRIANKDLPESPDGLLFLVDLAGSEMATDVKEHSTERMKETREINVSLSTLKDCIRGRAVWNLSESSSGDWKAPKVHIPFRSSALTKVLKHVFDVKSDRYCKTTILACVKPNANDAPASKNTLRYAELLRVPGPPNKPVIFNARVPSTWKNSELQDWITSNSGEPPVSPTILAPTETGSQLLKLPKAEFVTRCLKTEHVSPERARAFYDKFWRMHVDSRSSSKSDNAATDSGPAKSTPATPFYTRLRPGMIVRCKQWDPRLPIRHVCILAPIGAFGAGVGSVGGPPGFRNSRDEGLWKAEGDKYICAEIHPAIMPEAYSLALELQSLIALGEMEDEVLMEFDEATRMYFINI